MTHIEILLSQNHLLPIAEYLGRSGTLHLNRSGRRGTAAPAASREDIRALETYRKLSERVLRLLEFFQIDRGIRRPSDREPTAISRDANKLEQQILRLENEAEEIQSLMTMLNDENQRMNTLREQIEPLAFLETDLNVFREFRHMAKAIGQIPTDILGRLKKGLSGYNAIILPLKVLGKRTIIMAFAASRHEEVLRYALRSAFFEEISVPDHLKGTPRKILKMIDAIYSENAEGLVELTTERESLSERRSEHLLDLWSRVEDNRRTFESIGLFLKTREAYLITGWLPASERELLESDIDRITQNKALVSFAHPRPDEDNVPTKIDNPFPIAPFELLTEVYGVPNYRETDPTPFLALSSLVMFGAMFADVGHGMVLAIIGLAIALTVGRDPKQRLVAQAGLIVLLAGLSAATFGVLFGSVFGKEDVFFHHVWMSPMHNILYLFKVSVCFGASLVAIGLLLNIRNHIAARAFTKAAFDKYGLAGLLYYLGFLWTGFTLIEGGFAALATHNALMLGIPLAAIVCHEPLARALGYGNASSSWFTLLVDSGVEGFETVITFFSNTLSFVRIGAFALTHAGLCQAIYTLGEDIAGLGVVGWVIIIAGNVFIILFEGLIVAIQTLRLEYYEFFSKFFRSGGLRYRPFALEETGRN